jgi:hypothetical protein
VVGVKWKVERVRWEAVSQLDDFLNESSNDPVKDYILSEFIKKGELSLFGGLPGAGKTLLVQSLALHVLYGEKLLGREVAAGSVLMIDHETNNKDLLKEKMKRIRAGLIQKGGVEKGEFVYRFKWETQGFRLDKPLTWTPILEIIQAIKPVLITLDSLRACQDLPERGDSDMQAVMNAVRALIGICGSTVIVLHHFNKMEKGTFYQRLRGSGAILAATDSAFEVRTLLADSTQTLKLFGLIPQQRKHIVHPPIKVRVVDENTSGGKSLCLEYAGEYIHTDDPLIEGYAEALAHIFLSDAVPDKTHNELRRIIQGSMSDSEIRIGCRELVRKGFLEEAKKGKSHALHFTKIATQTSCPWCGRDSGF